MCRPDFLVDGADRRRGPRLNQSHSDGTTRKVLRRSRYPYGFRVKELLSSLGRRRRCKLVVYYRFSRPVAPWRKLKPNLERALKSFIASSVMRRPN